MTAWLDYLLKANLFLALFYACYWLWLRRHTFFRLNRAYLLGSVGLSLALPLVELPVQTAEVLPLPVGVITLPAVGAVAPAAAGPDWETAAYYLYGLIAAVLLFRLLLQLTGIGRQIRRSERQAMPGYTLVLPTDERVPTFSFLRYLVLSRQDAQTANAPIIAHELVHIRQWHSLDVLLLELIQVVFWLNPVLLAYKRSLRQVHEFLADAQAEDKQQYAAFLIDYAFGVQPGGLTNNFFKSALLKERIRMLHRRTTSRWALGKYVLVLPMLLSLLAMTSAREQISRLVTASSAEPLTVSGNVLSEEGKPLSRATVLVQGTTNGAQTDAEGRYQLRNVPAEARITASYVGYESVAGEVAGKTTLNFVLNRKAESLKPVVVVGYAPFPKPATSADPQQPGPKKPQQNPVFTVVEKAPEFPGGMDALGLYLGKNIRYPSEAIQRGVTGKVFVQFTVGPSGEIYDLRVQKGIGFGCDEEAVRVVGKMPNWNPGIQGGKPVAVQYVLPIEFQLERGERTGSRTEENPPPGPMFTGRITLDPNTKPLYIIDGEMQDADFSLNRLASDAIKSVAVLKGQSARAIYGEKGTNGVILITTKANPKAGNETPAPKNP
ncbi:M56 family metallopeptidase [Larkinella soli]|uniref:M56 family metallopeptidase n=1 Tax=Larkinella soli TaxID=1770527 RepID=UPI000FFBB808|nr:M56 family metallopeptidase [Larkinella soli]